MAPLVQLAERSTSNGEVVGSSPAGGVSRYSSVGRASPLYVPKAYTSSVLYTKRDDGHGFNPR